MSSIIATYTTLYDQIGNMNIYETLTPYPPLHRNGVIITVNFLFPMHIISFRYYYYYCYCVNARIRMSVMIMEVLDDH